MSNHDEITSLGTGENDEIEVGATELNREDYEVGRSGLLSVPLDPVTHKPASSHDEIAKIVTGETDGTERAAGPGTPDAPPPTRLTDKDAAFTLRLFAEHMLPAMRLLRPTSDEIFNGGVDALNRGAAALEGLQELRDDLEEARGANILNRNALAAHVAEVARLTLDRIKARAEAAERIELQQDESLESVVRRLCVDIDDAEARLAKANAESATLRAEVERLRAAVEEAESKVCDVCPGTGWHEDREGRSVCVCIQETEAGGWLVAQVEKLKALLCNCDEEKGGHAPDCASSVRDELEAAQDELSRLRASALPEDAEMRVANAIISWRRTDPRFTLNQSPSERDIALAEKLAGVVLAALRGGA